MKPHNQSTVSLAFFGLACLSLALYSIAPIRPERWFVMICLGMIVVTHIVIFLAKSNQPKPVNWLTVDVLFTSTFSIVHFGYFLYWITGVLDGQIQIWNFREADAAREVCSCLAMYLTCLNLFLTGYYVIASSRARPLISENHIPDALRRRWGKFGQIMIRLSFLGFTAFVLIVGPARFFGIYSGTNNISFVANIFFELGQVFAVIGCTLGFASKERLVKTGRTRFGISKMDLVLIAATIIAIGLHGDRSTLVYVLLAFMIAFNEYRKPAKLKSLVVLGTTLIFFLGLIVSVRGGSSSLVKLDPIANINTALVNLGSSSVCGFVAADYVPGRHDYFFGKMQLLQLLGIVPFARGLVGMEQSPETSSSMLLTLLIQGKVGKGVSGTGTSVFADFYLDFGFIGTAIIFSLLGVMAKKVQNRARVSNSMLWQVGYISLVTCLALCSR